MNLDTHPCFNPKACNTHGRVHLPVAPRCNIQCNFCNRKFDCVNETRPGVTSRILNPFQAMAFLDSVMEAKSNISVVGIAGPGDPMANPDQTLETLERVRSRYPDMLLCLATNGLNLPDYLDDIAGLSVSHVSITINAVDPAIGEKIYAWVRYGKRSYGPAKGASLLLDRQMAAVEGLKEKGIIVKVNTIVLPGINDGHVVDIARRMAGLGVDLFNCMPYYPNEGSNFAHMAEPAPALIRGLQADASRFMPQMRHCKRCRADAVGLLGEPEDIRMTKRLMDCASLAEPADVPATSHVAVATREGILVNQHLGEAHELSIYDIRTGEPVMIRQQPLPEPGGGDNRWHAVAGALADCGHILVSGAGDRPMAILKSRGIDVLAVNGLIREILPAIHENRNINHLMTRKPIRCGAECTGAGLGCM